jgi:hypothetical protein
MAREERELSILVSSLLLEFTSSHAFLIISLFYPGTAWAY